MLVSGLHEDPVCSVALCAEGDVEWMVSSGRSQIYAWRLDKLQKLHDTQAPEVPHPAVEAWTPSGLLRGFKE